MATCEVCGNDYDKAMEISIGGSTHVFDSFECAIHAVAPRCAHCGVAIVGHGIEGDDRQFCCAHCAQSEGITGAADRT